MERFWAAARLVRPLRGWLLAGVVLLAVPFARPADPPPARIMPLGDSITLGYSVPTYLSGYRDLLQALLADAGYQVDFVGTLIDTQNSTIPDPEHEGHGGWRIDQLNSNIEAWLSRIEDPDVVLLMIGTNDFLQNYATAQASERLEALVARLATARPHAQILLASIVPNTASPSIESAQIAFNSTLPGLVNRQTALGRRVAFIDAHAIMTAADLASDGIHPNEAGYDKLANLWFDAITARLGPYGAEIAPAVARLQPIDHQRLALTFSKPLEDAAAATGNFTLSGGLNVTNATLDAETKRVITLTTSLQTPGTLYTVNVSGVRDRTAAHRVVAAGTSATFVTPLIANGGFEFGLTGWSNTGNAEIFTGTPWIPAEGLRLLGFNTGQSTPNGTVSQTFATTPGQSYRLQFQAGVVAYNKNEQRLRVTVAGGATLLSQTLSLLGRGSGTVVWSPQSQIFVADSAATTLTFQDVSPSSANLDLLLDQISVVPYAAHTLSITSTPNAGVSIAVSPVDANGAGGGVTPLARQFTAGATVTITAPGTAGGYVFQKWRRQGVDFTTNAAATLAIDADLTLEAVYVAGLPTFTRQPQSLTAPVGGTATLSVSVAGTGPFSYQWKRNGAVISGATAADYTLTNLQAGHAGDYTVDVTNAAGTATSASARLTVIPSGVIGNGSFENDFDAWTASGNQSLAGGAPYTGTDGAKLVVFNGGNTAPNGVLTQTVATTAGQTYVLQFDAGVLSYNKNEQRLQVTAQGGATLATTTVAVSGLGGGAIRWVAQSLTFQADSATTTLTFRDVSTTTSNIDLLLDNVRVTTAIARTLTVAASPNNVAVTASPADKTGAAGGTTAFTRTYDQGTAVTLTAPATAGALVFSKWQKAGADFSTGRSTTVTVDGDFTMTAVYVTGAPADVLANGSFETGFTSWTTSGNQTITSAAPYAATDGVNVVVFNGGNSAPNAVLAQTFATTPGLTYTLQFDAGTLAYNTNTQRLQVAVDGSASLLNQTIPITGLGGGQIRWLARSYTFVADSTTTTLTFRDLSTTTSGIDLLLDHVRLASATLATLSVGSTPVDGVAIAVTPADHAGAANGTTPFTRQYAPDTVVGLTAPATSGTANFQKWQRDGVDLSTERTIAMTLDGDHSLVAVYVAPAASFANGSFEAEYAGWTPSGNQALVSGAPYGGTDGVRTLVFNGGQSAPNGAIAQTFNTTAGQSYTLLFDMGVLAYNNNDQQLQVTVTGNGTLLSQTLTLRRVGSTSVRWAAQSFVFTADSASTTLTFRDVSATSQNIDLMLDHIRVQ